MLMRFRQQALGLAKNPIAPTYVLLLDKKRKRQDSKHVNEQKCRQRKAYLKRKQKDLSQTKAIKPKTDYGFLSL